MEARSVGITWAFAPVCDLDIEPRNPIVQTRSFGLAPDIVGEHVQLKNAGGGRNGCRQARDDRDP